MKISPLRIVAGICAVYAIALMPTMLRSTPVLNDGAYHVAIINAAIDGFHRHGLAGLLDPFEPTMVSGYPVLHAYPPLGHLAAAVVVVTTGLPAFAVYRFLCWLMLSVQPAAVYLGLRWLGLRTSPAVIAAAATHMLATPKLHGWDLSSYTWRGLGLYAQLWAAVFMPLALGAVRVGLVRGRNLWAAGLLIGLTVLAHVVYGYIVAMTAAVMAAVIAARRRHRAHVLPRLTTMASIAVATSGFFVIPAIRDRALANTGAWMPDDKVNSVGWERAVALVVRGEFLDFDRWPAMTILTGIGLVVAILGWHHRRLRWLTTFGVGWFVLYAGRDTFGGILQTALPFSTDIHFHRFIGAAHFACLGLFGVGVYVALRIALLRRHVVGTAVVFILLPVLIGVVIVDRFRYLQTEWQWQEEAEESLRKSSVDYAALLDFLESNARDGSRLYAGNSSNWGAAFGFGWVPVYADLLLHRFPEIGPLWHLLSLNADVQPLFNQDRQDDYEFFGIRRVVAPPHDEIPPFLDLERSFGKFAVYRAPGGSLVGAGAAGPELEGPRSEWFRAALVYMESEQRNQGIVPTITLSKTGTSLARFTGGATVEATETQIISVDQRDPEAVETVVRAMGDSVVYLRTAFHPNWHVSVNGRAAKQVMAMPGNVGVRVGPGEHRVNFAYRPDALKAWILMAGIGSIAVGPPCIRRLIRISKR